MACFVEDLDIVILLLVYVLVFSSSWKLGLANRLNNSDVYTRSFWKMTLQKYLSWCFTYFVEVVIPEEARDGDWLARPTLEDCE